MLIFPMAVFRSLAFLLLPFLLLYYCANGYTLDEVKPWCSQTPNPQPCEYYFLTSKTYNNKPIKQNSDFFKLSVNVALDRAKKGLTKTRSLGPKCRNAREKAAWSDCLELYELTINRIIKTINPNAAECTQVDAQTWLSTALTNLETCMFGFYDLGVTEYVLPLMSDNVTQLLSNALSLNKVPYSAPSFNDDGFPSWVKPHDRKLLQAAASPASQANVVVATDGSGNYKTVKEAVNAAPKSNKGRYVIHVKAGVYNEQVEVTGNNIMLVGDGIRKTIITGSKSVGGGTTTFRSATVAAVGDGFIARDITFRNTAGPSNHQAVAFRSGSDLSVFYRCSFEGYQDTLYVHSERQFYRECDIYGTVDFIFGNAAVILQNCNLYARTPPQKTITFTAQGRTDPNQNSGIIIHNSKVIGSSDFNSNNVKAYLGRPWKKYSRTVFIKCSLGSLIDPAGWMQWSGNFALDTLYYAEYANTGSGSSTANRVKWKGYRVIGASEASQFTVNRFLSGSSWLPATGVPFTAGL
ncbi:pectinesterase 2-like [Prosopis cineraria]|uniref:pectinesterase 2-like n=1 Tax=Prosopis cineraria TaxID=364024 RepID=UPI00240FF293|nr:pectinesterase 2-like [Prosopis cineraria]